MVAALSLSSTDLCLRGSCAQRGVWRWHCPAQPLALLCRGCYPRDTVWPLVQGWFITRGSLCVPGVAQPFPHVPAILGTLSTIGPCWVPWVPWEPC